MGDARLCAKAVEQSTGTYVRKCWLVGHDFCLTAYRHRQP